MEKSFYKIAEVSEMLAVSKSLVYRMIAEGALPAVRLAGSRARRVPAKALQAWIAEQEAGGAKGGGDYG